MDKKLEMCKFCEDKQTEWCCDELLIWIEFKDLQEFTDIVGYEYLSDGGTEARLLKDYIAFDLVSILEYLDVSASDIKES